MVLRHGLVRWQQKPSEADALRTPAFSRGNEAPRGEAGAPLFRCDRPAARALGPCLSLAHPTPLLPSIYGGEGCGPPGWGLPGTHCPPRGPPRAQGRPHASPDRGNSQHGERSPRQRLYSALAPSGPCLGTVPAYYTSRLLAFLSCRSFPGLPRKEMRRRGPSQGRSRPWGVLTRKGGQREAGQQLPETRASPLAFSSFRNGSGAESAAANPTEMSCK